ncbi:MAG: polysaccharide biosynthesis/export family protein, partial [Caulobacteraceae bacterium]
IEPYTPKTSAPPPAAKTKAGAKATAATTTMATQAPASVAPTGPADVGATSANSYDYVLGPGDKLRITVFGEENLSGEFTVAGNGHVSFPLIGDVQAAGQTVRALQFQIIQALKDGYLKDPRVSAEVLTFRPYFLYGEVSKPGEYPYADGITVLNAVATAGGFTYRANQKFVFIKRPGEVKEQRVLLTPELQLAPGETVRIVERFF